MGKSHIIAFVALLMLFQKPLSRVYVVYPTQALLEKDRHLMDKVQELATYNKKLAMVVAGGR